MLDVTYIQAPDDGSALHDNDTLEIEMKDWGCTIVATIQTSKPIEGLFNAAIYQDVDSTRIWVRPYDEFMDGRFEELSE